jgi:hypothetical protein
VLRAGRFSSPLFDAHSDAPSDARIKSSSGGPRNFRPECALRDNKGTNWKSAFTELKGFGKSKVKLWDLSGPCEPSYVGHFSWKWTLRAPKTFFGAVLSRYHRGLGLDLDCVLRISPYRTARALAHGLVRTLKAPLQRSSTSSSIAVHNHVPHQLNAKINKNGSQFFITISYWKA